MDDTPTIPVRAVSADPPVNELYAWLDGMRGSRPVDHLPQYDAWQVFRYADAQQVLVDGESFSGDLRGARRAAGIDVAPSPVLERLTRASFFTMDRPTHRRYRALVNQAFTARLVTRLEPRIRRITADLFDQVAGAENFDLLKSLAHPLPMIVLCELLGVPPDDRRAFQGWAEVLLSPDSGQDRGADDPLAAQLQEMETYLHERIARCRADPGDDLISRLVDAEVDGERLTDDDITSLAAVLLLAGHGTTAMLLSNAVLCLDEQPAVAAELRADPSLLPGAIEEVFRYRGPLPRTLRLTTREVTIGGQTIPANRAVIVWTASANMDEAQFPEPWRFDIRRTPNRHLGFGHGMHFCLGAPLARMVSQIALMTLFQRCAEVSVDRSAPLQYRAPRVNLGVRALPVDVRWT
ncbi:cytochrome P450 [Mangrovihabitans endophyticus]|uniref:Cytochrome P450 n=1 Tax=Mangrovihabitans endophyticus TaxID=1751298 RepID=A0A8J3BSA2_9ACTN|nr:cytochrome P450 [Mangrovihabitans endophyticus]GGK72945.1 cytochrome P450 [Mangrovihabitans endophyticus]